MKRKLISKDSLPKIINKTIPSIEFDEYLFNENNFDSNKDILNRKLSQSKNNNDFTLLGKKIKLDNISTVRKTPNESSFKVKDAQDNNYIEINQTEFKEQDNNYIEINQTEFKEQVKINIPKNLISDREFEELSNNRLKRDFYSCDGLILAKNLLGKIFIRYIPSENAYLKLRIVETEAYIGPHDKAAHCYNNRKTERTKFFWQDPGRLYVYCIYSINYCLNISSKDSQSPEAILIRAVEPFEESLEIIKKIRKMSDKKMKIIDLANGPGKTGACLEVNKSHNGLDLCTDENLFIVDCEKDYRFEIEKSVRINIDYAEEYRFKPWRFFIKNNKFVSKVKIPYDYRDD